MDKDTRRTKARGRAKPHESKSRTKKTKYSSDYLCESFLEYFRLRAHEIAPSAPLLPEDPTLLFTSAGMVPFKSYYRDPGTAPFPKAASVQKCLRAGGKQSDLENVGKTLRHHTFFEMLGNFSFGDYFKREAVDYGWELSVDVWRIDPERIWISIYQDDDEAHELWTKRIGLPAAKVIRLGKEDNFWGPVGSTGICGPCSELYFDTGPERGCRKATCKPGCDCDRFIEYWNLVFPQFFLMESGIYEPLSKPGIDTGLGLERLAFILQGVEDNFHTDCFLPIRNSVVEALPGGKETKAAQQPVNVATDHIRALTFALAEGILPSNEGRGYILRRLLRRALTKLHPFGVREPFLARSVDAVIETMRSRYPELTDRASLVKDVVTAEEKRFLSTLEQGLEKLRSVIDAAKRKGRSDLPGEEAFVLYDTYGFPLELTQELALDAGLQVDVEGFSASMMAQKERARQRSFHVGDAGRQMDFVEVRKVRVTKYLGYDALSCEGTVGAFRLVDGAEETEALSDKNGIVEVITDQTVFYAESGGQVGDTGVARFGTRELRVLGAYPLNERIVHQIEWWKLPGLDEVGAFFNDNPTVQLTVDKEMRLATARNHTATHLLHTALRQVLGDHVVQAGSLVEPARLRFDFHHFQAMRPEEIAQVEAIVNRAILEDRIVTWEHMPYEKAIELGAMALFGEKYTDSVRVVTVEDFSRELCGGTHLSRTGETGLFLIKQESAVAAGVRRIEALTGTGALQYVSDLLDSRNRIAKQLKVTPDDIERRIKSLLEEQAVLKKRLTSKEGTLSSERLNEAMKAAVNIDGIKLVSLEVDAPDVPTLRRFSDMLREKLDYGIGLLCQVKADKPVLMIVVSQRLTKDKGIKANELAASIAETFSFRGGGKAHLSQMGLESYDDFVKVKDFLIEKLSSV
ncbi:MAG: alanine--tRNA ligase [Candidatus Latescibacteria bacterium]|nr:alanine--tRNA ligase [Candidatus Latescibacterota bacterium]NIM21135.1 alanine--tRNA ligase [Candidatus Latescibacterota bacterium]NIM65270.1 alanine--tRNA ligase [Candidatus Latescibacterota bacterium]NIO01785.1 alanine--tRNA ligase [Candidatus Latescibacterota bacterium]NIO28302.1 alanine--tRNA ligase [Candidatus Latescibacterota bacterium]